jgi:ADP-heptose:LPS heptosyltransferase
VLWGSGRYLDGHGRERDYWRKSVLGADLRALLQALAHRPVNLWNLQVGPDRQQGEVAGVRWSGSLAPDADFLALAQLLQQLDLLICVDTAAAHLAGAMGLEAWVLLPWAAASRWQRHRTATIWYPSLRLWRQPRHGDWLGLWPDLLAALDQRLTSN